MVESKLALNELDSRLEDFVRLDPKRQRWLMTAVGRKADSLNRQRVTRQVDFSGAKYKGRKQEVKKKMFLKLKRRQNMYLKVAGATAKIGYWDVMGRTAYEHHHGLTIRKSSVSRSSGIGSGRRGRVKGGDPCTKEQAGILFSFIRLGERLKPAPKVTMRKIRAAEQAERKGREKRGAAIKLIQSKYRAAKAGHTIARWNTQVTRVGGNGNRFYTLPQRHLLGVSGQDLPILLGYAQERLQRYLLRP